MKHIGETIIKFLLSAGLILPTLAHAENEVPVQGLDWVEDPPGVNVCQGHYLRPVFPEHPALNLEVFADESFFLLGSGESELTGNVRFEEPDRRFLADSVMLTRNEQGEMVKAKAKGGILFETPDYRIWGDEAELFFTNNELTLWNAEYRYYLRQARGKASEAHRADNQPIVLKSATYTTCPPGDNLWDLRASKVVLNQETGRGESWNTRIHMENIPVFYLPYLNFPIDDRRQSGFLTPEFRTSTINGASVRLPYYLNLAPNYDATLYPYYMDDRGLQLGLETRFLTEQVSGHAYGEYLYDDRRFAHYRERKLASSDYPDPDDPRRANLEDDSTNRWLASFAVHGTHGRHWKTYAEYIQVSDDEYLIDFGNNTFGDDERQLRRRLEGSYSGEEFAGSVFVQDYQTLQPFDSNLVNPPYRMLPSAQGFYFPYTPEYPFVFTLGEQFVAFRHSYDPVLEETPTWGNRYHLSPTLAFPMRPVYGFMVPQVTLMETYYDLTLSDSETLLDYSNSVNKAIPVTSLDAGLIFERDTSVFGRGFVQTLEPRMYYLYVPNVDQNGIPTFDTTYFEFTTAQLFRYNRFSGVDRIGDANQVTLALTSRYYDQETGDQRFNATIGQIYYFKDREVMLCNTELDPDCYVTENPTAKQSTSPITADALYRFDPAWYFVMDARYDPSQSVANLFSGRLHYQVGARDIVHVGFRYEDSGNELYDDYVGQENQDLLQSDLAFAWGLGEKLTVLGRWYYDLYNTLNIDAFGGFEYEGCCYAVRFGARRYLMINTGAPEDRRYDTEVFFQWIFKGLGGVGRSPVDYFTTMLPGYQDRFEVQM